MEGMGLVLLTTRQKGRMRRFLRAVRLFLVYNVKTWTRFRISFFMELISVVTDAAIFLFIGSRLIGERGIVKMYGGDFASFVIVGIALARLLSDTVSGPYRSLSRAYWSSRLEPVLISPCPLTYMMIADMIWDYAITGIYMVLYLALGTAFGVHLNVSAGTLPMLTLALALSVLGVFGIGLMSASLFNLINAKSGEPLSWLIGTLQGLVCGIYCPVVVLPAWLRRVSVLLPQTYAVDLIRRLVLPSYRGPAPLIGVHASPTTLDAIMLVAYAAVLLPLGWAMLAFALRKARSDGSLSRWA